MALDLERLVFPAWKQQFQDHAVQSFLLYRRDDQAGAQIYLANGTGVPFALNEHQKIQNAQWQRFENEKLSFLAHTASNEVSELQALAKSLQEKGLITSNKSFTVYEITSDGFDFLESKDHAQTSSGATDTLQSDAIFNYLLNHPDLDKIDSSFHEILRFDLGQAREVSSNQT